MRSMFRTLLVMTSSLAGVFLLVGLSGLGTSLYANPPLPPYPCSYCNNTCNSYYWNPYNGCMTGSCFLCGCTCSNSYGHNCDCT